MPAPFNDIAIANPPRIDRRGFASCVATATGIRYGMVVVGDDAVGNANHRDVELPAGAGATRVRGVVSDQGNPNATPSGNFAVGAEFGCCIEGDVEVLLDAGQIATTDQPCITGTTVGTVKPVAAEAAPYDVVGRFAQDYDNSGGGSPVLVSIHMGIYRRFA